MPVNVNTQKALGGNNPIKLSGGSGDANNSIAGFFEASQGLNVPFSSFYRKTNKDLTRDDFDADYSPIFVPDATENSTVATSGPISFSDFRGQSNQGVIKEYVVTQSSNDVNLTLTDANWNSNLDKNVPKVANINGRLTSGLAPTGQDHSGYDHKAGAALNFDAEAYNLIIDVNTGTGDNNNFSNDTGVFGFGGQGGTLSSPSGSAGGTAMFVRQNSTRAGASAIIKVDTFNGRLHGGGGGGEAGRNGNAGNTAKCKFISKPSTLHRIHNGWDSTIRNKDSGCYNKSTGCPQASTITIHGVTASDIVDRSDQFNPIWYKDGVIKAQGPQSACNPASGDAKGRSRCRDNGRFRGTAGNMGCFRKLDKRCAFSHKFDGNTGQGGTGGGGGQGKGGTGQLGAGGAKTNGNCPNCNDPSGGNKSIITTKKGNCGNSGTAGKSGGGYGDPGGNTGRTGAGGAGGYALFRPPGSQVQLTNTNNNMGSI